MKMHTGITQGMLITHTMMVHMAAHITGTGTIGMRGDPTLFGLGPITQYMDIKNQTVTTAMLNHQETVTTITCIITGQLVGMMGIPMPTMDIQAIHIHMHLLILVPMLTTITTVQVALTQMVRLPIQAVLVE
jgi:hypothetical protein